MPGFFVETFQAVRCAEAGIVGPFVQHNLSRSCCGVLRGSHVQNPSAQGELVTVLNGWVCDVAVDVRPGSATFGQHVSVELSDAPRRPLWMPRGFAHDFVVLSESRRRRLLHVRPVTGPQTSWWCAGTIRRWP
jgi:dTDP-4-dehydrorhamnose 3,5-epimerase